LAENDTQILVKNILKPPVADNHELPQHAKLPPQPRFSQLA